MNLKTCILFTFLAVTSFCNAQKNFEGTVIYTLKENNRTEATLTVEYGARAILATFADDKGLDKEQILILLDSLAVLSMNTVDKTYRPKYYPRVGINNSAPPVIGGYKTRLVPLLGRSGLGSMTGAGMYVSDDLVYVLPPAMKGAEELVMVSSDDRVVLGFMMSNAKTDTLISFDAAWSDPEYHGVLAKATSIKPHKQEASLFAIPADFTRAPSYDEMTYDEMADSTMMAIDTAAYEDMIIDTAVAALPPPPPPPPPAKKKPVNAPAKKPAKKTSSPARKEKE